MCSSKIKPSAIRVGYDLALFDQGFRVPIYLPHEQLQRVIISGASGTGKTYGVLFILRNFLKEMDKEAIFTVCDFKNGEDFSFLKDRYALYFAGEASSKGLQSFYDTFIAVKEGRIRDNKWRILLFDEWAGFQIFETQNNKKQAEAYKSMLLNISLLGRSMRCGIFVILQRCDTAYLNGRENFNHIAFGKLSQEAKKMVVQGEEFQQRNLYGLGEGILVTDQGIRYLKIPKLRDLNSVKKEILFYLNNTLH